MNPLLPIGGLALVLLLSRRSRSSGVLTVRNGVTLTPHVALGLAELATETGLELDVTSGKRSAEQQARAMLRKFQRYHQAVQNGKDPAWSDDLTKLYRQPYQQPVIQALYASPPTLEAWTAVLERFEAQGVYMSEHQLGNAADIDSHDNDGNPLFTEAQRRTLRRAVTDRGWSYLEESDHIHLGDIEPA